MKKLALSLIGIATLVPLAVIAQQELTRPANTADSDSSPLAEYPGFGHDIAAERRAFAADDARRQNSIAQCMRDAGFQYRPVTGMIVQSKTANETREERRQGRPGDPNRSYRESLSDEKLTQYNLALYGIPDPNDQENLWDPASGSGGGCWGEALRSTPGVFDAQRELNAELIALRQSIQNDSRVRNREGEWADCMQAEGFDVDSISQYRAGLANGGDIRGKPSIPLSRLADLDQAGRTCLDGVDYAETLQAVTVEKESAFVERHRDVLERRRYRP